MSQIMQSGKVMPWCNPDVIQKTTQEESKWEKKKLEKLTTSL